MTLLRADGRRFRVRTAGVAIEDGRVLVCCAADDDYQLLPGGGVEAGETSDAALLREMREELEADVRIGRLLWCVENLFTLDGERAHEFAFFWEMTLPSGVASVRRATFEAFDGGVRQRFTWVPIAEVAPAGLLPAFLSTELRELPERTQFLVERT